jgi:hypothetical protein
MVLDPEVDTTKRTKADIGSHLPRPAPVPLIDCEEDRARLRQFQRPFRSTTFRIGNEYRVGGASGENCETSAPRR